MRKVLILGAGKIGGAIVDMLGSTGDYQLTVADKDQKLLNMMPGDKCKTVAADVSDAEELRRVIAGNDAVVSALPYFINPLVAEICGESGAHYFDLTEDVETTRSVKAVAARSKSAFVPQCGLAPGFISIVAHDLAKSFEQLRDVHMRVGALPEFPVNGLKYNLTWSTDGLINEYCNPCEAIHDGKMIEVLPLEGLEEFSLDGIEYEAFNTSGGLGTLCETLNGKVSSLNYKTVRYPGHRDIVKLLLEDLGLRNRREILKDILEASIPITQQDVVLIFVTVSGIKNGRLTQETYAKKIYAAEVAGKIMSAIQITTSAGMCAMVDLFFDGYLPQTGFVRQEDCDLGRFLGNRFGKHYA